MPLPSVAILKRLVVGVFMLLAIVLFVPAGSAHAHGMGAASHSTSVVAQVVVEQSGLLGQAVPGCDGGSSCCLFSYCSQVASVLPGKDPAPQTALTARTPYATVVAPMNRSLRSGPVTPPPRLDA